MNSPGQILREARLRHEVSQGELATRAGTTQSAISRLEKDRVSPSVETLKNLLFVLGEDLILGSEPRDFGVDRTLNRSNLSFTPQQRVTRSLEFANFVRRTRGVVNRQDA
ncbi:MAG TPA: helix-turn-helix transcriptional regulator [Solirubrobacterales bacterium]|jgi:transcriptional regulator with XRE-family HTH domain|nr:helix-turn-helix transcriptional regulator [Solirubrobacterales bacterium]